MAICPTCRAVFEGDAQFCPRDGAPLAPEAPTDPLVGRVLGGRYRLADRLGQGGMGTVYRAHHTLMDKPVAVKVLRGDLAGDPEAIARFHREARSASRLDHEHCIRVTDFGVSDDGLLFLVMELLEGESLGALMKGGALDARRAATVGRAIAAALTQAHEQAVIHRDLKPDNVFLARRGSRSVVKVLDFGLAKIAGEIAGGPSITKAGVVFGTPEYMAPEQAEGGAIDARSDLYSLGVILYHMLTGGLPFQAPSFLALLSKHLEEIPQAPRARRPDLAIPEELERVVLRLLEKDPQARFQCAADVVEALAPFAEPDPRSSSDALAVDALRQTPVSGRQALATASSPSSPSMMSGEVVLFQTRRKLGRGLAIGLGALALAGVGVVTTLAVLAGRYRVADAPPTVAAPPPPSPGDPLEQARLLIERGDLDGASTLLTVERKRKDGVELQLLLGELAMAQSNPLGATAHYHRATLLAPEQAEPHARLASHLAVLGQRSDACREAKLALARDARSSVARAAAVAARCPGSR